MTVVGITGTIGAGKGTVVDYLVREKCFRHFSVREFISEEIVRRGLAVNRDNMVVVANSLRNQYGNDYIVKELYERALQEGVHCVIESIRTTGEIESLRARGNFFLLAVDADQKTRYARISGRGSSTDHVSFEEFVMNEEREMQSSDPGKQNLKMCMKMSDALIMNDGDLGQLHREIEIIMQLWHIE